jgi:hypothetical protein
VGTQRDENDAEHRHQGGHPHPDYARGEHPEELDTEVPDFARGQRHGEATDLEGNFASGQEEGPTIPADHGDYARGGAPRRPQLTGAGRQEPGGEDRCCTRSSGASSPLKSLRARPARRS